MSANMGGTEIFGALDFVYKQPLKPGYPRQVQWLFEFWENITITSGGSRIFPRGGAWTLQGGREHAKFSQKLHEIERIWTPRGGRASLTPPP